MQTSTTNNAGRTLRLCASSVRLMIGCMVVGMLCGNVATGQIRTEQVRTGQVRTGQAPVLNSSESSYAQLPGWDAPGINQPAALPSNEVRTQIGLATYPEIRTARTNTPISLPPEPTAPTNPFNSFGGANVANVFSAGGAGIGSAPRIVLSPSDPNAPNRITSRPSGGAPGPLLAPVHAPIQIPNQNFVRSASFETEVSNPATDSVPAANGFGESPITTDSISAMFNSQASGATSPEGIWPSIKVGLLLAVLSLAPAIILMTTCYVRVVVVLTLLRQAFGGQQLPPMQVITALSLFLTMLIMAPVWNQVKTDAIDPYTREQSPISWEEAWQRGIEPVKHFMITQIEASGNTDSVAVFYKHLPDAGTPPTTLEQVPINVLLPAFLISELKVAFLLGFQIFLPFLVLDLVVSSVTVSSGMMMLPPTMVSFPLKLILFVMVDGWNLVVGMLLQSFAPI